MLFEPSETLRGWAGDDWRMWDIYHAYHMPAKRRVHRWRRRYFPPHQRAWLLARVSPPPTYRELRTVLRFKLWQERALERQLEARQGPIWEPL